MGTKLRMAAGAAIVVAGVLIVWRSYSHREIRRGEHLEVQVIGTLLDQPVSGIFRVEEDGKLTLGPAYGRVAVEGLDADAATAAVKSALSKTVRSPEVSVSRLGDDVLSRLEAENHRLQTENNALRMRVLSSRVTSGDR
jgi:hypothetical protein